MTTNERIFHLIGFIDATIWLERSGYLKLNGASESTEENEEDFFEDEDLKEYKQAIERSKANFSAIISLIISVETGEY